MAFSITPDTIIFGGTMDSVSSPLINRKVQSRPVTFTGGDGKSYQVSTGIGTGAVFEIELFEVNKELVTRTSRQLFTPSEVQAEIFSASGLTSELNNTCLGPLGNTGRLLFSSPSVVGSSTFSTWRVNSSGNLVCEAAVQFAHGSSYYADARLPTGCFVSGNQTSSDSIYLLYGGYLWYAPHISGYRLPSVSGFVGQNGSIFTGTQISNNNVFIDGGDPLIIRSFNTATARPYKFFGWCLPDSDGDTRYYYYIGEPDVASNATGTLFSAPGTGSSWINSNAATYGNQLLGYISLGTSAFTTGALWVPGLSKSVAMSHFVDEFDTPVFPYTLHIANGLTYDSDGKSEFFPAPTVKKLSDGTYMVVFAGFLDSTQYGINDPEPLGRYKAFIYTPATERYILVAGGTFKPTEVANILSPTNAYYADEMSVEYDETLDRFFYQVNVYDIGAGDAARYKEIWGVISPVYSGVPLGTPTFLEEADVTYKDFTARYP
jgi:hypothetical protein